MVFFFFDKYIIVEAKFHENSLTFHEEVAQQIVFFWAQPSILSDNYK